MSLEVISRSTAQKLSKVRMVGEGLNEIIHISEALDRAEDLGLDLVLVSLDSKPPVVRIQDFKKLEYEKKKARKASRATTSVLKEIQLKVNISEHDLETKINKIDGFLGDGDKVKISVRLKGREKETPQRAEALLDRVVSSLKEPSKVNRMPPPLAAAILEPVKTPSSKKPNQNTVVFSTSSSAD